MNLNDPQLTFEAKITGLVQGVNFRLYTQNRARQLGVKGWVKNHLDGSVRVLARGPQPCLLQLIESLWIGPTNAHVDNIDITWIPSQSVSTHFSVIR